MDDALGRRRVDGGNGFGIEFRRFFLVACFDSRKEFLDLRFKRGLYCFVLLGLLLDNQYSFFCGFNIRHDDLLILSLFFLNEILIAWIILA